jgi:hypothetical protein
MSKIGAICNLLNGAHVLETDALHDYHVAREIRNAARCPLSKRASIVRLALHPYRVVVSVRDDKVRIYRPDLEREILI